MSQATTVFNDPRQLYAGTAKFDGSLEDQFQLGRHNDQGLTC